MSACTKLAQAPARKLWKYCLAEIHQQICLAWFPEHYGWPNLCRLPGPSSRQDAMRSVVWKTNCAFVDVIKQGWKYCESWHTIGQHIEHIYPGFEKKHTVQTPRVSPFITASELVCWNLQVAVEVSYASTSAASGPSIDPFILISSPLPPVTHILKMIDSLTLVTTCKQDT